MIPWDETSHVGTYIKRTWYPAGGKARWVIVMYGDSYAAFGLYYDRARCLGDAARIKAEGAR